MFRRVVLATDFSKSSDRAYAVGIELAKRYEGKLFLLHVVQPPRWSTYSEPLGEMDLQVEVARGVTSALAVVQARFADAGVDVVVRHRVGDARIEIVQFAREISAHAILMASHGHGGLYERLLGGTTDRVVRRAGCPVLVASGHMAADRPFGFDRVLFPTDLTDDATRHAARLAESLAPALVELHLLHVAPAPIVEPLVPGGISSEAIGMTTRVMEEFARKRLEETQQSLAAARPSLRIVTDVRVGFSVARTVLDYRKERELGMIAVPVSGRSADDPHYLGRTAESLLGKARVPVLILK